MGVPGSASPSASVERERRRKRVDSARKAGVSEGVTKSSPISNGTSKQLVFDNHSSNPTSAIANGKSRKKLSLSLTKECSNHKDKMSQDNAPLKKEDAFAVKTATSKGSDCKISPKPSKEKKSISAVEGETSSDPKQDEMGLHKIKKELSNEENEQDKTKNAKKASGPKRTKSPGVRVIGGRIYDSENGKTCHQCRQKTLDFMASCKNINGQKPCTMNFCPKCLLNRYGEKVEEAVNSVDWKCPRCRGLCNCSICMKKQGHVPTGILVHTAKATGFSSVSDLLQCKGLTKEHIDALNGITTNGILDPIHSGNMDVKDIVKKLKTLQVKQPTETLSPKKERTSPMVSPVKDEKFKKPLTKSSTPSKESILLKTNENKSKRKSKVNIKNDSNTGKLDIGKDSENACCIIGQSDDAVTNKRKTKKTKLNRETGLSEKDICGKEGAETNVIKGREKKSDASIFSNVPKQSSPKIKGQLITVGEDLKGFAVHETIEPLKRPKLMKQKKKENEASLEICSSDGNAMPVDSTQVPNAAQKKSKKRKSDSRNASKHEDILKGTDGEPTNVCDPNTNVEVKDTNKKKKLKNVDKEEDIIVLPQGKLMQSVAGIEFGADDVGSALQFLEFCSAFENVLDIKKGQPESILRELMRGRIGRRGVYSSVVQFHVKLLSLIGEDNCEECEISHSGSGENSWVEVLRRFVKIPAVEGNCTLSSSKSLSSEHQNEACQLENIVDASLRVGAEGYDVLHPSRKLRLLNMLCDESLSTGRLRDWIESANARFIESKKEHKEEVMAAKEKAKEAKQKMKDEVVRVLLSSKDGHSLTINEHDELISKVKLEAEKAQAEKLNVLQAASRMKRQRCDAVRTEPIVWNENGRTYWKLKGGSDRSVVLLQDINSLEPLVSQDQWFTYNEEEENILAKYVSSTRVVKARNLQQCRVSPEQCNKMVKLEPVCANGIVSKEVTADAAEPDGC